MTTLSDAVPHAVHGPPSGPVYPALQEQAVRALLAFSETESDGQSVHGALPVVFLYLPAVHDVQGATPVNPRPQGARHSRFHEKVIPS